jgi:phospholipid-binding lipoprotein MlaA
MGAVAIIRPTKNKPPMLLSPARAALVSVLLTAALGGCATAKNPRDPLEPLNRAVYSVNEAFDTVALKPAAYIYRGAVPPPVRGGVTSFFGNFRDVTTAINNLLQFKVKDALSDVGRIAINSTVGILGVFDVATRIGLDKHEEDFGQTLAHWGMGDGPYLMLPLLGPSTVRDAFGWAGDYFTDPEFYLFTETPEDWIVLTTRVVNVRANLLPADLLLEQTTDRYVFLREAYLQRRLNLIYDGNLPGGPSGGTEMPRRKTLKEMEEEFMEDEPPNAPATPPQDSAPK